MEYPQQFNILSVTLRLGLAIFSGAVLGYGRARKKQNAGLRTYILTSIGAALTMILSLYEYEMLSGPWAYMDAIQAVKFDASRFSAQVISGIGFLAAGTILAVAHQQVSGLTTAIGLFAAACMGIAAGAGFYVAVLTAAVLVIITMEFLQPLELAYKRSLRNITVYVEMDSINDVGTISDTIASQKAQIFDVDVEPDGKGKFPAVILTLKLSRHNASHSAILSSVAELSCVRCVQELIS